MHKYYWTGIPLDDASDCLVDLGHQEMKWNYIRCSDRTLAKDFSLSGWLVTGTDFPGKWSQHQAFWTKLLVI